MCGHNDKNLKKDIRVVFLIFSGIFGLLAWKNFPSVPAYLLSGIAFGLLVTIIVSPLTLQPIFRLWLKVAKIVGDINAKILLTIIFAIIFTPVSIFMRLLGKDPMKRKLSDGSYWEPYEIEGLKDKGRYKRQF